MELAFLKPRAGGPRLRFCASLLAVEEANNLVSYSICQQGLLLSQPGLRGPHGSLPLVEKRETREMEVAPRVERWMHRHQGPPQDKGQGCPSFPLPCSQTKVWTLVLRGGHRKLFI